MLDFKPDEEQQMLIDAINRFSTERVRKEFREAEETAQLPVDLVQSGWEIGVLPTVIPEEYGGFGEQSAVTGALAVEEFAYGDLATALAIMSPNLVAIPLMVAGTDEQQAAYLPRFVDERPPAVTAALVEPVLQFDPRNLSTTATRQADRYLLNGHKSFVPLADAADVMLVYANEEGKTQAFLVDADHPGVTVGRRVMLMGLNALPMFEVNFDQVELTADRRVGGADGIEFGQILNRARVALGAAAVGIMRASFEYARDYAKQREQFGRPIAQNQSIAFMLADMASDVESARLMVWEAAWQIDQGQDATRTCTVMKQFVDRTAVEVADRAVQTLGGYGYIREYPVELWLRNARAFAALDGMALI